MPKIKMSRTERGSRDGLRVETFVEGQEYDVPDSLVVAFQTMGALAENTAEATRKGVAALLDGLDAVRDAGPNETPEQPRRGRKPKA